MTAKIHCKYDALVDPKLLTQHPRNRNKHTKAQLKQLGKIFKKVGFRSPIIVSKNSKFITKGNGSALAAVEAGLKEVPVVFQEYFTDDEEYAHLQGDNGIGQQSKVDRAALNDDLKDLGPDFDLDLLGLKEFTLDPPKLEVDEKPSSPEGVKSTNGGGAHVLRLFYTTEQYEQLLSRGDRIMEDQGIKDLSELFKALVDQFYESIEN